MTIYGLHMDGTNSDTRQAKIRRAILGVFYGVLAAMAFVLIAAFIDIWLHPDLPLGVNWPQFWTRLLMFVLGLGLVGAVTCWWNEAWPGLLSGAATAAAFALIVALFSSSDVPLSMKFIVLFFILVPIAAMIVPVTYILRWLVERHMNALRETGSYGRIAGLILLTLVLGCVGGYFMKMSARQLVAVHKMNSMLQTINTTTERTLISNVEGVPEHAGMPYTLYAVPSETSTEGFDIRAVFGDGYVLKCTAVLYPGRPAYLTGCSTE